MKKIVVLTGAGISAESGISTFRDSNGLWENHAIEDVASPEGWVRNPKLVLDFYNQRRRQLFEVQPNAGHEAIVALEQWYDVQVITQNVDDLHERAGSTHVLHLHGELRKVRPTRRPDAVFSWEKDLHLGDLDEFGDQLRPHIVWFGEDVPKITEAAKIAKNADIFIIVGTSLVVYPAAGLVHFAPAGIPIFLVDPNPNPNFDTRKVRNVTLLSEPATTGMAKILTHLQPKSIL